MSEQLVRSVVVDFLAQGYEPNAGTAVEQTNYLAALKEFREDVLRDVVDRIRNEWPNRTWPVSGLLRRWAVEAEKMRRPIALVPEPAPQQESGHVNHAAIMAKLDRDTYHVRAWVEAVNEHDEASYENMRDLPKNRTGRTFGSMPATLTRLIAQKQAAHRKRLGLPEPRPG